VNRKELEQARAKNALDAVRKLEGHDPATRKAYTSYAKSLPANILMNGLGQAVAMAMSKAAAGEDGTSGGDAAAWRALVEHLEAWLLSRENAASPYAGTDKTEPKPGLTLMQCIIEGDQNAYLAAQAEALAYLEWLKKFANALLGEATTSSTGEDRP